MSVSDVEKPLPSPCVSICALDENDVCAGCFRTGDEISQWGKADNTRRRQILADSRKRAAANNPFLTSNT